MPASSFFLSPTVSAELRATSPTVNVADRTTPRTTSRTRARPRTGHVVVRTRLTINIGTTGTLSTHRPRTDDPAACLNPQIATQRDPGGQDRQAGSGRHQPGRHRPHVRRRDEVDRQP